MGGMWPEPPRLWPKGFVLVRVAAREPDRRVDDGSERISSSPPHVKMIWPPAAFS